MKTTMRFAFAILFASILLTSGCGVQRVFYKPTPVSWIKQQRNMILAADFGSAAQTTPQAEPPANQDAQSTDDKKPADETQKQSDQPAESKDAAPKAYTVPGTQFQQLALLALSVSSFGISDTEGAGKEVSESSMMLASAGAVGLPGLAAPQAATTDAIVSLPGLQQGFASGLGFASPDRNIFTARFNPLSGAAGRCQELANTGFFSDRAACETHFRP